LVRNEKDEIGLVTRLTGFITAVIAFVPLSLSPTLPPATLPFLYIQNYTMEGLTMTRKPKFAFRVALTFGFVMAIALVINANHRATSSTNNYDSATTSRQDPKPFDQKQALADLKKQIAGKENQPSSEVFKNMQMLKTVPAGRLLAIMEIGYSKSLGVDCTHCHTPGEWEKEDKPTKQITREMAKMSLTITNDLLKNIKNLKGPNAVINCTTCHRGQVKPALNMPN
jgi:hypothetical protein